MKLVLSGIQPTGLIHLGNYLGAVKNWKLLQEKEETLFLIVDNHAITSSYFKAKSGNEISKKLRSDSLMTAATLKAIGIKNFVIQSHVQEILSLSWIFSCISPMSWFQTMTQYKVKKAALDGASLGIFSYPCLMAADILTFKGTHVPVGDDQTQHLELVNDIAQRFNTLFGDFFPQPKTLLSNPYSAKFPRIMNLRDGFTKMSKSSKSDSTRINLIDPPDLIRKKISKSKTDSIPEIFYDESRLEVSNLLRIFAEMKNISTEEASKGWKDIESFKSALSEILIQELSPIRQQTLETINSDELKNDLKKNAEKAREVAAKTLAEVNKLVGFS